MFPLSDASHPSRRFALVNVGLILATAYVFYLQLTASDPEAFIQQYALVPALVDLSNIRSLLPFFTSIFLHGGFLHIISNMWFLWVFGDNVEGELNPVTYVFLYIASGLVGGVAQYLLQPSSTIPMLGASGAVAGVLGAYFVYFPHHKIKTLVPIFVFLTVIDVPAIIMLGYWFILQMLSGAASLPTYGDTGGVAFFAHIGGFLTGLLLARMFRRQES